MGSNKDFMAGIALVAIPTLILVPILLMMSYTLGEDIAINSQKRMMCIRWCDKQTFNTLDELLACHNKCDNLNPKSCGLK